LGGALLERGRFVERLLGSSLDPRLRLDPRPDCALLAASACSRSCSITDRRVDWPHSCSPISPARPRSLFNSGTAG